MTPPEQVQPDVVALELELADGWVFADLDRALWVARRGSRSGVLAREVTAARDALLTLALRTGPEGTAPATVSLRVADGSAAVSIRWGLVG